MTMRMKAAVLQRFGAPLEVIEVDLAAPRAREVMVKVTASGICGSDVRALGGGSVMVRNLPCVLGHEAAGVVVEAGPDASVVRPGDHVIIAMNGPCGWCRDCVWGRPQLCTDPARRAAVEGLTAEGDTRLSLDGEEMRPYIGIGAFAEYVVVRERMCVPVDPDLPLDLLALTACGVVTGIGAVFNTAKVEAGSRVLVLGCGGVGLSLIQGAVLAGATEIIAVDVLESKLSLAKRLGATRTLCWRRPEGPAPAGLLAETVHGIVPGGVDYAFDATGVTGMLVQALAATCPGGTAVMVGIPPLRDAIEVPTELLTDGHRRLVGTQGGDAMPDRDLPRLVDFYRSGRLNLESMVGERVPLDQINDAISRVRAGTTARSLVLLDECGSV